jgi:hypothetical protein
MRPAGDFQHLPSWREQVVAITLALRRHYADTLIVLMTLLRNRPARITKSSRQSRGRPSIGGS